MTSLPAASRETLGSRIGFLLLSAGCAVGLGNVWRFPHIVGTHGGAAFVLMYLVFLFLLAAPIMVMEFSVGRASRMNVAGSFRKLEPKGSRWHLFGPIGLAGNYLLMMFYTTVSGWMLAWFYHSLRGNLAGLSPVEVGRFFDDFLSRPGEMVFWMALCTAIGFGICGIGLRRGVERFALVMMSGLFLILIVLVARAVTLPGASEGLSFYLQPDLQRLQAGGVWKNIYAAMGQAFFTLSIGIGSMAIFGSYISRERSLTGETVNIVGLDTLVAILAGLVIFPACFAFGVRPDSGPGLVFVTLPNVFNHMPGGGVLWGGLFFLFMTFAALSTVVAVFENLVSFGIDIKGWSRRQSSLINFFIVFAGSLPCALGFNLLANFQPLGEGSNILALEDFILSNNILPLGSLVYLLFCCSRYGWGWNNFIAEADTGRGMKFPQILRLWLTYALPVIIVGVIIVGYLDRFALI